MAIVKRSGRATHQSLLWPPTLWVFIVLIGLACYPRYACGQTRNLQSDLKNLDVRHRSEHYALAGTVTDTRLAEYARALEYIYAEYANGFDELLGNRHGEQPTPEQARFRVVILSTGEQYSEFTSAYFGTFAEHTSGMFVPLADLLIIRDHSDVNRTYGTLFHEGFHQFVHRHLPLAPTWINEALATFFGTGRATRSGLVFDQIRHDYFQTVRTARELRQLIPLGELMRQSSREFYRRTPIPNGLIQHRTLAYAQSYTLVVYMLREAGGREHIRSYLRSLAQAKNHQQVTTATEKSFPADMLVRMVDPWLQFVQRGL